MARPGGNPEIAELGKASRFKVQGSEPLDKKPICTRLPESAANVVRSMKGSGSFIREAILEKLIREGLWTQDDS